MPGGHRASHAIDAGCTAPLPIAQGEARVVKESSGAVTRRYPVNAVYADLLAESGRAEAMSLDELRAEVSDAWGSRVQTQMFRSPLIAFLYERGWRQNFRNAGFPGIGKEYEEAHAPASALLTPRGVLGPDARRPCRATLGAIARVPVGAGARVLRASGVRRHRRHVVRLRTDGAPHPRRRRLLSTPRLRLL